MIIPYKPVKNNKYKALLGDLADLAGVLVVIYLLFRLSVYFYGGN